MNGSVIKKTDIVFKNAKVYTVDKERSWAEAIAVSKDKIVYVGDTKGVDAFIGDETQIIDLDGKTILPGFFDTHCHPAFSVSGVSPKSIKLNNCKSVDEIVKALKEFAESKPNLEVIYGMGWEAPFFSEKGPRKEIIDEIISDRPVCLTSSDGHSAWVNSKAIEMLDITKDTPDPEGGYIERDDVTGEPSGTFKETARDIMLSGLPQFDIEDLKYAIKVYAKAANEFGITNFGDAMLDIGEDRLEAYRQLDDDGELTLRGYGMIRITEGTPTKKAIGLISSIKEEINKKGNLFNVTMVKFYVDGVLEAYTAYLKEPYNNGEKGEPLWNPNSFKEIIAALDKENIQIHAHVIGDAALSQFLDALEYAVEQNGKKDSRHGAVHLHIVDQKDIQRYADLGVMAFINPYWHVKEDEFYPQAIEYIGQERADNQYPIKSFLDNNIPIASSSDYPVTQEFSPFIGMFNGVTKRMVGAPNTDDFILNGKEAASLDDMIASYTINAAYSNFLEDVTGSIEVGKKADLIVVDQNPFEVPLDAIPKTKVLLTVLEGKEVYINELFENVVLAR